MEIFTKSIKDRYHDTLEVVVTPSGVSITVIEDKNESAVSLDSGQLDDLIFTLECARRIWDEKGNDNE